MIAIYDRLMLVAYTLFYQHIRIEFLLKELYFKFLLTFNGLSYNAANLAWSALQILGTQVSFNSF